MENSWFDGSCVINSYRPEELLGTKMRALYQRKKGRDLFDLHYALTNLNINSRTIVQCYKEYMAFSVENLPSQKQFIQNMEQKMDDPDFEGDIYGLLRPGIDYNQKQAYKLIKSELMEKI